MRKYLFFKVLILLSVFLIIISSSAGAVNKFMVKKIMEDAPVQADYPDADGVIIKKEIVCDYTSLPYQTQVNNVIKVFNERGIERFGKVSIRYDEKREEIILIDVYTIKPDGEIIKVSDKAVHDITPPEIGDASLYSNIKDKIINFPELEPGSIIIYNYVKKEMKPLIEKHFWKREQFAYLEPVEEIKFSMRVNKEQNLYYETVRGDFKPDLKEGYNYNTYTWFRTDVPPVSQETAMPPLIDIVPVVKVSTFKTWRQYSDWYSSLISEQYKLNRDIREKIEELTADYHLLSQRIKALYNYTAENIRHVQLEPGIDGFKPHPAVSTFENGCGNSRDTAVLLIAMLNEIDVDAEPVLIGTDGHSNLEVPGPVDFNHMIVYLTEQDLYLDPTSNVTVYGNLPVSDQGKKVLLPVSNRITSTPLAPAEDNCENLVQNIELSVDGTAAVTINWLDTGVYDASYKSNFKPYNSEQRKIVLKQIINSIYPNGTINEYQINGVDSLNEEFKINVNLEVENYGQVIRDNITIQPFSFPLYLSSMVRNKERENPLYMGYKLNSHREINITAPEGYKVSFLPEDFLMNNRVGSLTVNFESDGNELKIVLDVKTKKHIIDVDEYQELRSLFNTTEDVIQQQIMFSKGGISEQNNPLDIEIDTE